MRRWRRTWCRRATGKKPHIVVDSWPRAAVARVARSNSLTEEEEEMQPGEGASWGWLHHKAVRLQLRLALPVALRRRVRRGFCNFLLLLQLCLLFLRFSHPTKPKRRVRLADYAVETSASVDIAAKLLGNLNRSIDSMSVCVCEESNAKAKYREESGNLQINPLYAVGRVERTGM